jgi:hypothetical protein
MSGPGEHWDVFVSYAHDDAVWVQTLADNLHRAGLDVFLDAWEIVPGARLSQRLQEGLAAADVVVLVVSAAAVRKPWWQEEFAGAMPAVVAGRQRLIPVLLDEVDVPPFAAARVYIDFRYIDSPDGYEAKIHELVAAVRGQAPRQRPPRDGTIVLPPMGSRAEGPRLARLRITPDEVVFSVADRQLHHTPSGTGTGLGMTLFDLQRAQRNPTVGVEVVAVVADEHAEQVVAGVSLRAGDPVGHVGPALPLDGHPGLQRQRGVQQPHGAFLEFGAVGVGHAEQFADHQRRHRQREVRHQVRRPGGGFQVVERRLDDLGDPRLQPAHPAHGELRGQHPAQPRVLRRVEADQLPGTQPLRLLPVEHLGPRDLACRAAEPVGVGQHLADVLVAADEVRGAADRRRDRHHALVVACPAQFVHRVEAVAAHRQRRVRGLRHRFHPFLWLDTYIQCARTGLHDRSLSGLRSAQMGLIRPRTTWDAATVAMTPRAGRPGRAGR